MTLVRLYCSKESALKVKALKSVKKIRYNKKNDSYIVFSQKSEKDILEDIEKAIG